MTAVAGGHSELLQRLNITLSVCESKGFGDCKVLSVGCYIILWLFLKHAKLLQSINMGKKGCGKLAAFPTRATAMGLMLVSLSASKGLSIPS